jgi:O-antigen/teichoic acid export membrane protein
MVGTVGFILIMVGRTGWDLSVYLVGLMLDVGLALLLAGPGSLGLRGAAIAQASTLTFSAVARLTLVHRFVHIWPFNAQYLRLLGPTAAAAVAMALVHAVLPEAKWFVNLVGSSAAGIAAYVVAMLLMGMTPTERDQMKRAMAKLRGRRTAAT